jgi:hypothetical protein
MMRRTLISLFAIAAIAPGAVFGQSDVTVNIDRGVLEIRPFTAIYPQSFRQVEDGSEVTVLTLQHNEAPIQCDVLIAERQAGEWNAEAALVSFDQNAVEATWRADFPDFAITAQRLTSFQSGPALYYEGEAQESPLGFPVKIVHAEAVDQGRTYIFECLMELALAAEAVPTIEFMITNFSTRSDAECCVPPAQ